MTVYIKNGVILMNPGCCPCHSQLNPCQNKRKAANATSAASMVMRIAATVIPGESKSKRNASTAIPAASMDHTIPYSNTRNATNFCMSSRIQELEECCLDAIPGQLNPWKYKECWNCNHVLEECCLCHSRPAESREIQGMLEL